MHDESDDVTDADRARRSCAAGYQHGDRLLRPAMVGVTDPVARRAESDADATDRRCRQPRPTSRAETSRSPTAESAPTHARTERR